MPEDIHPGSWVGDTTAEFKKLPTWGKFAAVGAVVLVAGIGWYEYNKAKSTGGTSVSAPGSTGTSLDPNAQMGGTQSPFAQVPTTAGNGASVPVIPFGDTPIFDTLGNLIGWQQPGVVAPGGTTPTANPFTWPSALAGMKIWQGTTTHNFFFGSKGPQTGQKGQTLLSTLFPAGTTFGISPATPSGGKGPNVGGDLTYELPGSSTFIDSGMQMVNPVPAPAITKNKQTSPPAAKKVVKK